MAEKSKVYGLILPKKSSQVKAKPAQATSYNVFGDESDEEEKAPVSVAPFQGPPSKVKRQTQMDIDKALLEDPSVYEYDEIYDEMQANKPQVGAKEKEKSRAERKPRYITGLLKAAEVKKKEDERRKERQVQKEREAEGEMYADKEKFVTSAYKQKMLEMQAEEEKERREAALEAMTDVTKQKDMSGFYRYLYRQTTSSEATAAEQKEISVKEEPQDIVQVKKESSPDKKRQQHRSSSASSSSSSRSSSSASKSSDKEASKGKVKETFSKSGRPAAGSNFRKRRADTPSSSDSEKASKKVASEKSSASKIRHSRSRSWSPKLSKNDERRDRYKHTTVSSSDVRKKKQRSYSRSPENRSTKSRRYGKLDAREGENRRQRSRSRDRDNSRRSHRSRSKDRSSKNYRSRSRSRDHSNRNRQRESEERHVHKRRSRSLSRDNRGNKIRNANVSTSPTDKRSKQSPIKESVEQNGKAVGVAISHKDKVAETLKEIKSNSEKDKESQKPKAAPVDPAKKVYPHHNSPKDIAEARKRYLQRKIARERQKAA